jgi:NAD(P)-dependent dehydrogenase (short-subunit alcohol dehydrogenase family)
VLTDKHIRFVIDTSADDDHTGGNENLSKAGWALPNESINPIAHWGTQSGVTLPPGASILCKYGLPIMEKQGSGAILNMSARQALQFHPRS